VILVVAMLCIAPSLDAQRPGGRRPDPREFANLLGGSSDFYAPPDFHGNVPYDGRFTFARIKYRGYQRWSGREGPGWSHDYPDAEIHFMRIMKEITSLRPFIESGPRLGGVVVALDDPLLFRYPVAYLSEPGGWFPNDIEAKAMRSYMQKGGFVIVDDFWGQDEWDVFEFNIRRVFPEPERQLVDITLDHPLYSAYYKIDHVEMTPAIGNTVQRTECYGCVTQVKGMYDDEGRLMMVVNFNTDLGDAWEWAEDPSYPLETSTYAFEMGTNIIVYSMSH